MPIFQDDLEQDEFMRGGFGERKETPSIRTETEPILIDTQQRHHRRLSEESIRTDLCEGPLPDSPKITTPEREHAISDRVELIERLKRGESPTWIPNRHVSPLRGSLCGEEATLTTDAAQLENILNQHDPITAPRSPRQGAGSPSLLPPAQILPEKRDDRSEDDERLREGLSIERPRSALHTGDFTQEEECRTRIAVADEKGRANNFAVPARPWIATSPPRDFAPFAFPGLSRPPSIRGDECRSTPSSLSSSFSSSFVYKPPTSPLVQSESNEDLDLSLPLHGIDITSRLPSHSRRHTLYSATSTPSTPFVFPSSRAATPQRTPSLRRESMAPYQAHQPRRSLNSTPNIHFTSSSPGTPAFLRQRRPSFSSDTSPLQHASMVGSYEESILRGRMSTTPSKPLDFLAQIGVLGLGKCKPGLRCPPHVTLSFPAVYYSYANTSYGRSRLEDGPSPYVGQIDLENGLPNSEEELRAKRKTQARHSGKRNTDGDVEMGEGVADEPDMDMRSAPRPKRRSASPKAPPGGSYRIPEKGRIQIIIKNQNKTAVKLFLVGYDLTGMEPGTKTFIRQRSYSGGPIIGDLPGGQESGSDDRPILRYLIHLHICCPSKGRFYLYKSIRIVFANRVPDGKEKLRNETTWPEPRYIPYKPIRVMHPPLPSSTGPGAILAAEKAFRRRSSGYSFGSAAQMFDGDVPAPPPMPSTSGPSSSFNFASSNLLPVEPVPFRLPSRNRNVSEANQSTCTDTTVTTMRSPSSGGGLRQRELSASGDSTCSVNRYEKLSKGDIGYGGNAFAPGGGSPGTEGLLSQRLRSLGVKGLGSLDGEGDQENDMHR